MDVMISTAARCHCPLRPPTLLEAPTMDLDGHAHDRATPLIPPLRPGRELHDRNEPIFDQGLAFDVETLMDRRKVMKLLCYSGLAVGLLTIAGCAQGAASASPSSAAASAASGTASTADCDVIPEETAGPFPGDGSNGPDVLN